MAEQRRPRCGSLYAGTPRGFREHKRRGERECQACSESYLDWLRLWRLKRGDTKSMTVSRQELFRLFAMVWNEGKRAGKVPNPYGDEGEAGMLTRELMK